VVRPHGGELSRRRNGLIAEAHMLTVAFLNPHGSDPNLEYPHTVNTGAVDWTEFYFFFAYDHAAEVGINIHMGRESAARHVWRAVVSVFLPGGELLVLRSYGSANGPRGPTVGPLSVMCVEPLRLWSVDFDGFAQPTTRSRIVNEPHRDAASERVRFQLLFEAASPIWDPHPAAKTEQIFSSHFEQICRVHGRFEARGRSIDFRGAGARDHSSGCRNYSHIHGHFWINGLFSDGTTFMAQHAAMAERDVKSAYMFRPGGAPLFEGRLIEGPYVADAKSPPGSVDSDPLSVTPHRIVIELGGQRETIQAEIIHCTAATLRAPSEEYLGTDRECPNALQFVDAVARFLWDGKVGYGVFEKSARIRTLR
jgi:hypothetical protein